MNYGFNFFLQLLQLFSKVEQKALINVFFEFFGSCDSYGFSFPCESCDSFFLAYLLWSTARCTETIKSHIVGNQDQKQYRRHLTVFVSYRNQTFYKITQ